MIVLGAFLTALDKVGATTENVCEWAFADLNHLQGGTLGRLCFDE